MNERIKQLAEQARQEFLELPTGYTPEQVGMYPQLMQKFAELIVQECAQAFEAEVDTWKEMDPYQGSMKRKGTQAIKQHFGVGE